MSRYYTRTSPEILIAWIESGFHPATAYRMLKEQNITNLNGGFYDVRAIENRAKRYEIDCPVQARKIYADHGITYSDHDWMVRLILAARRVYIAESEYMYWVHRNNFCEFEREMTKFELPTVGDLIEEEYEKIYQATKKGK
jgi:hypothetical protein